jgi:protein phosphatase
MKLNLIFNYLPLAVLIDEQILCVHGGIGNTLSKVVEIEQLKRPIQVNQEPQTVQERIVRDLLWSEYDDTLNDVVDMNVNDNKRMMFNNKCDGDRSMLVYGKERLDLFLNKNQLSLLICSHQWIFEGVKAFNNDKLIIVYSSTNYMNVENNPAGILTIAKRTVNRPMQIIPKLINVFEYDKGWYKSNVKLNSPLRNKK